MPTYQYACALGHSHEEIRPMSEGQREFYCPACGEVLKRVFWAPPVTFKGRGFYSTGG